MMLPFFMTSEEKLSPMHLVIYSPYFYPRIGGLETVVQVLSSEWTRLGHEVTIITDTPNCVPDAFSFRVLRRPGFLATAAAYRAADAVILANVSLWGLIPLLFCGSRRPPWIATHHIWYENPGHPVKPLDRLKKLLARFADANISVSHSVNKFLKLNGCVIPNPYDHFLFRRIPKITKDRDLVFLGRLVSDKGCDLLLGALAILNDQKIKLSLTIIGSGPEQDALQVQVKRLLLNDQVIFAGSKTGEDLVSALNKHRILVVPSRWNEPFGIVALEGIACGCVVVGSNGGGLHEAIGPCGHTFANGDVNDLAANLLLAINNPHFSVTDSELVIDHLSQHAPDRIAQRYIDVIKDACKPTL